MTGRSTTGAARIPRGGAAALVGVPGRGALAGTAGVLLGLVLGTAGVAGAGPLSLASSLGSGTAVVGDCGDLSAVQVGYAVTAGTVRGVTLSGVPASCRGAVVRLALVASSGAALATAGPVTVTGPVVTLPSLTATPAPGSVAAVHLSAVGP